MVFTRDLGRYGADAAHRLFTTGDHDHDRFGRHDGESLLTTFNSASYEVSVRIPREDWDDVIVTVGDVARRFGLSAETDEACFEGLEMPEATTSE